MLSLLLVTVIILINISCFNFTVECCGIVARGMCMCIQLLLVSGLLSAFGFPFLSPREFSGFTPHYETELVCELIKTKVCFR